MSNDEIAKWRAVIANATPGPWESLGPSNTGAVLVYCDVGFPVASMSVVWNRDPAALLADAAFIAAAREGWPAALDESERLRAQVNALGERVVRETRRAAFYKSCALSGEVPSAETVAQIDAPLPSPHRGRGLR